MKTAELTGADLDYWVARAQGLEHPAIVPWNASKERRTGEDNMCVVGREFARYSPSTNWAQGGPIIQRERLHLAPAIPPSMLRWDSFTTPPATKDERWFNGSGDTPLIAAMRCYIASKFGEEVETT